MGYRSVVIIKATDLTNFLTNLSGEPQELWYRGVNNRDYDLTPSAYRSPRFRERSKQIEMESMYEARSKMEGVEGVNDLKIDIEWLSFLQHQGVPTRLLDWTPKIDTALYFAFEDYVTKTVTPKKLPCLWVLKPKVLWQSLQVVINKNNLPQKLSTAARQVLMHEFFSHEPLPSAYLIDSLDKTHKEILDKIYIPFECPERKITRAYTQGSCFIRFPILDDLEKVFEDYKLNKFFLRDDCFNDCLTQLIFLRPDSLYPRFSQMYHGMKKSDVYPESPNFALDIRAKYF